jgi:RNA polymerase sigma-70 factor (ECF subfamily)
MPGATSTSVGSCVPAGGSRQDPDTPRARTFEAIYDQYARMVLRWAARLGGPGIDAEDVAQEVFLVAHRRLGSLRAEVKPSTWLFGITTRVVLAQRRRQRLRRWLSLDAGDGPSQPIAGGSTPLETVEQRRALALGYGVLERMPEALRDAFILFEIEGLTTEEIADVTGTKPATTRVRLHRARALFYARLEKLQRREQSR